MAPSFRSLAAALILALGSGLGRAEAQATDSTYGARALARFLDRNHADTQLPDSLRNMTIGRLDSLADQYFVLLDDTATALYVRAFAGALDQLSESQCARLGGLSGEKDEMHLVTLLALVDSATVDTLLLVHELALLAAARPTPQRVGTQEEMQAAIVRLVTSLTPDDQQRFTAIALHPPPSQSDACWADRTMFGGLAKFPSADLGPVMRRMTQRTPTQ